MFQRLINHPPNWLIFGLQDIWAIIIIIIIIDVEKSRVEVSLIKFEYISNLSGIVL